MTVKSIWLRKIHKWVGVAIGLQFLLWALSGTAMALLDMGEVAGGAMCQHEVVPLPAPGQAWPMVQAQVGEAPVTALAVREMPTGPAFAVTTAAGTRLFDAASGVRLVVDAPMASAIAIAAHHEHGRVRRVERMSELTLAVREHELPIWRVDFDDSVNSSYYVSAATGQLLERRNDTWRWWDFFWMLHNMDYADRTSFNHPLIITVGVAMAWLAVTGFWLLFRTMWRHDYSWLRRVRGRTALGGEPERTI